MKKYDFYKNEAGWFIDLPEYIEQGGSQGDLAMVLGADTFLDKLSGNSSKVSLWITDDKAEVIKDKSIHWDYLIRADIIPCASGKYYSNGVTYLWLCDVTLFVFEGGFPKVIHYKKV